jgi:hypothetical protein
MHRSLTEFHKNELNGLWYTLKYQFIALCKVELLWIDMTENLNCKYSV